MEPSSEDSASFEQFSEQVADYSDTAENPLRGNFYSVFVPPDVRQKGTQACKYVYKDKVEAMKIVKKTKKARFKHFDSFHDALKFAAAGTVDSPKPPSQMFNGSLVKSVSLSPQIVNERLSPFKGPKPQDLVKLRKSIETGDVDYFKQAVWENPRYLVSNGDTPSILQEGFRYNALHVAAKAKNGMLAELILSTVSNPKFVKLLYGDDINENVDNRIQVLLDLYLNTPDKGLNETPLHFAAKYGSLDVVEVLVSFPQCDKTLKNKYGQTADMIICDRCDNKEGLATLKKNIALHLENCYYVPVLRAEDNSVTPLVGEPFSPGKSPVINKDPLSPRLEIHAYAGPMNKEGAEHFRKVWKTPPRTSTPIGKRAPNDSSFDSVVSLRYTDPTKGLERLGQKLAAKFDVTWKEYWSFLDCFVDIASEEGLNLLENYLAARVALVDKSSSPSSPDSSDESSKRPISTIADLCLQMQNCNLDGTRDRNVFNAFLCVEKACNVFANRIASEIYHRINENFYTQATLLEIQTKQVELLVLSYMDDSRFNKVNFSQLHPRLGLLTGQKMCYFVEKSCRLNYVRWMNRFVAECTKAFDCFSSDDEGNYPKNNKPTSSKKQLICLMQNIANNFGEETEPRLELDYDDASREAWSKMKECTCTFHFKRTRKSLGLSRSNSSRHSFKQTKVNRKLFVVEKTKDRKADVNTTDSSSSEEEFFTPPGTPSQLCNSDDEEPFSEAPLLPEVFIERTRPTKNDCALYKALKYSDCQITPTKYPNVYRWYHNISLYSDAERESWPRSKGSRNMDEWDRFATPPRYIDSSRASYYSPPSNSWFRITGVNSPRASLYGKINM